MQGRAVVGLDLAQTKQAVTFSYQGQPLKRMKMNCAPQHLARALQPLIGQFCAQVGARGAVIAMEPASYFWELAAERFEAAGLDYVLLHTLSVKREREATRYTTEKMDPRDADLACDLAENGRFTEARLPKCAKRAALDALAREYLLVRERSGAELTRLKSFWGRVLPELGELLKEVDGVNALAISRALLPFAELAALSDAQWVERVRAHADGRVHPATAIRLLERIRAAHADPHRRSDEGLALRIALCAERRRMLERQKADIAAQLLRRYHAFEESVLLDSIPGSSELYNAITLGLVGDFRDYDCARAVVKLAGSEVNQYQSGEWTGRSRISHRGRTRLRTAAYLQAKLLVAGNDAFRARYAKLLSRPLQKQQAYVALADAYLRTAHTLVVQGKPWREEARSRRR
ncbi:MAG TPA: transposase [Longimicrobium sp.]|nr:transposase [Longimicrobium sp.]